MTKGQTVDFRAKGNLCDVTQINIKISVDTASNKKGLGSALRATLDVCLRVQN